MAELAARSVEGDAAGAELALNAWRREPGCPPAAVALLVSLLAGRGDHDLAAWVLVHQQDPRLSDLAFCLNLLQHRLVPGKADLDAELTLACSRAAELAGELESDLQVIPSLVAAQKAQVNVPELRLLRQALEIVWRRASHASSSNQLLLCQAQAQLASLAGDEMGIRLWAQRGLAMDAYDVTLALLLAAMTEDLPGRSTLAVLAGVAVVYPDYPDVQAALIRRQIAEGHAAAAKEHLDRWLERQPGQALALRLKQELAA